MTLKGINSVLLSAVILFSGAAAAQPPAEPGPAAGGGGQLAELYDAIEALSARVAELEAEAGVNMSLADLMSGSTYRMYWKDSEVGAGWTTVGMGTGQVVLNSDGTFAYPQYLKAKQNNGTELNETWSYDTWGDLSVLGEWVVDEASSSLELQFYGDDGVYTPGEDMRYWYQVSHDGTVLMSWVLDDNLDAGYFFTEYVAGLRVHDSASLHQ
ncbi:hypothetical protein [Microbulbifer zhoushanensis]|uniref:hypothetical protein n=1 Tax=Microbulbifer zhoushanensis TaxID=2904254 RepID=UPI001F373B7D|nr:hypothetical protein [Microbulbifer zhoushanensis]